ncbi:hypothetical protein CHS0354_002643 [Potamilus streckersoni]|uniref:Uncharacterized protein n=1 Tax=Potamilus streckersoni TaxID=2493646 RepID=A0AAE0RNS8_9BIVA|nr:hypothetical protein CHS0354_002643 [Potamilus streckersoni]
MKTLLFPLKIRGLQSLQKFLDVLRKTNHRWIADTLLETDIERGLRKAIDFKKSLRYFLAQQENSAEFKTDLNEHLFGPVSKLTSPPTTRNGFAKHLDRTLKLTGTGYSNYFRIGEGEDRKGSISSRVPEKLRELDKSFENESANNRNFISVLKEKELAMHTLFRQNHQEQREIEQKEKAISEIQG